MKDPKENRPGYKKTKVGWIPEVWDTARGSDIAKTISKGASPKWQGFEYVDSGMLFVTSENVRDGMLDVSKPKYLPIEFHKKLKRTQLRKDDILLNLVGASIGRSCRITLDLGEANNNQAVAVLRLKEKNHVGFISYFLQAPSTVQLILEMQVDAARPNISLTDIRDFVFPLPPLPEQKKIADILSTWDLAIDKTKDLVATKRRQKKGLMQQLLTGNRRLPGFEGPSNFQKLKKHVIERTIRCRDRKHLPLLSVTNNRGFVSQEDKFGKRVASADISNYKVVEKGEFAYNPSRVNVGSIDILLDRTAGLLSPMYVVFAVECTTLDPLYFRQFCDSHAFVEQVRHLTQGSVRDSLGFDGLTAIKCFIPSIIEQKAIAKVLDTADREIQTLESKLAALERQKKGLMQRLLTGQIRVKV